ncbi:dnaJ homolog subfamily C member 24 isoform X1 [Anser cygnoides]|uniref:dnaJ homolog subfamily C member 24 isoform X1 n=1 Tax=Anser cygnoides TaxID=8845 RepID=UPI00200988C0|nr:dnaJ homolog subfamily C member 24 isoform X1 [Anser cygnoides]
MAFERITQKDWYKILGAKPSDSPGELKRKYQRLALLYHPDKQKADVPAGEVEERVQRFIEIDQAWKILGNEETKKEYDLQQRDAYCDVKQHSDLSSAMSPTQHLPELQVTHQTTIILKDCLYQQIRKKEKHELLQKEDFFFMKQRSKHFTLLKTHHFL